MEKIEMRIFFNLWFFSLTLRHFWMNEATTSSNVAFWRFFAELLNSHGFSVVQAHSETESSKRSCPFFSLPWLVYRIKLFTLNSHSSQAKKRKSKKLVTQKNCTSRSIQTFFQNWITFSGRKAMSILNRSNESVHPVF